MLSKIYIFIYVFQFVDHRRFTINEVSAQRVHKNKRLGTPGLDERIDEGVLWWFGHVETIERDNIAKRVYVGECAGSRSEGRPRKR